MAPTLTRIDVDAGQLRDAARGLAANANSVSASYTKVSAAMQSIGGMAGSDPAAQEWGAGFDEFLAQVLDAHYSAVGALANCAELTDATAVNHLNADGQSVVGPKPPPEALGISKENLAVVCHAAPPPSAGGAGESRPWWWAKIEHLVGNIWPNGHQDRLHSAAAALRTEQIARALQAERRSIGQEYKDLTPEPMKSEIYGRNQEKYGDPLGPTYDYLKNEKGLTDQQIIEGAKRTGGGDLGLGKK